MCMLDDGARGNGTVAGLIGENNRDCVDPAIAQSPLMGLRVVKLLLHGEGLEWSSQIMGLPVKCERNRCKCGAKLRWVLLIDFIRLQSSFFCFYSTTYLDLSQACPIDRRGKRQIRILYANSTFSYFWYRVPSKIPVSSLQCMSNSCISSNTN